MTQKASTTVSLLDLTLGFACAAAAGTYLLSRLASAQPSAAAEVKESLFSHALPKLDGAHLEARVVDVRYEPGGSSSVHTHPCPVIAVVTEGAIRTQVEGEPEAAYKVGGAFYEAPNANADKTKPALQIAGYLTYLSIKHWSDRTSSKVKDEMVRLAAYLAIAERMDGQRSLAHSGPRNSSAPSSVCRKSSGGAGIARRACLA